MVIQLTNKCNLNCFYCKCHGMELNELSVDEVIEKVKSAAEHGETVIDFGGGEPLMHPNIEKLVKEAKQVPGVEKVTLTTNGVFLPQKLEALNIAGIDGINIHMDASDAYSYAQITGEEMVMNEVLQGLWTAVARDIPVALSVALHEKSLSSIVVLTSFAKKMDIKIRFVDIGTYSEDVGLNETSVVKLLSRHIEGLHKEAEHTYISTALKGKITFTDRFEEAFA